MTDGSIEESQPGHGLAADLRDWHSKVTRYRLYLVSDGQLKSKKQKTGLMLTFPVFKQSIIFGMLPDCTVPMYLQPEEMNSSLILATLALAMGCLVSWQPVLKANIKPICA
ncbi:MAG: hypothetical protein IPG42_00090 [Betaproteobacteria bacterium]|nr:hypothetical protein [Betaproteobacteria bacterium]